MRFEEKIDCYIDTATGLEWFKENLGPASWEDAMAALPKGWRLPTIEELFTIVDYTRYNPATELPGMTPLSYYWSSTILVNHIDDAWNVNFYYGNDNYDYKSNRYYVRAVRSSSGITRVRKPMPEIDLCIDCRKKAINALADNFGRKPDTVKE